MNAAQRNLWNALDLRVGALGPSDLLPRFSLADLRQLAREYDLPVSGTKMDLATALVRRVRREERR